MHDTRLCTICEKKTTIRASVTEEKWQNGLSVTWIHTENARVGLFGFEKLPVIASVALEFLSGANHKSSLDVIVVPNRKSADGFQAPLKGQMPPGRQTPETHPGSRYSFILNQEEHTAVVLLNAAAIGPSAVRLALSLLSKVFSSFPRNLRENGEDVVISVFDILKKYSDQFGIPFFTRSDYTDQLILSWSQNLHYNYSYYQAVKAIVSEDNLKEAAEFLQERMDIVPKLIDWAALDLFGEALGVLWRYVESGNIVQSVSHVPALRQLLHELHVKNVAEMKNNLGDHQDISHAMDEIGRLLAGEDHYASRQTFFHACCNALANASSLLEPRYVWPNEYLELLKMSEKCQNGIETNTEVMIPGIGSYPEVMALLEAIFEKNDVYQEVPIVAGIALFQILASLFFARRDYVAYRKGLEFGRQITVRIGKNIEEIQRKNPGSIVTNEQMILPLLTLAWAARSFNESREAVNLEREAAELLEKHSVPSLRILMDWRAFMENHDIDLLARIYQEFQRSFLHAESESEDLAKLAGHLASAFFEKDRRHLHLQEAKTMAMNYDILAGPPVDGLISNFAALSVYLFDLQEAVFDLELRGASDESIKKAMVNARVLTEEMSAISPARSIPLRTMCLCSLLQKNALELKSNLDALAKSASSPQLAAFSALCRIWLMPGGVKRRLAKLLSTYVDTRDPWNSVAVQFLNSELNVQLERTELLDYDAVVFVEGKDDVVIYQEWAKKLFPDGKLLFIRADGWTNFQYFANARVAVELRKPTFVIFDGDTDHDHARNVKDKLVDGLMIPQGRIHTLAGDSVESYLLMARPIRSAFRGLRLDEEALASLLTSMDTKRNKKKVLETVFRRYSTTKYDGRAGARIASHMRPDEINDEVRTVFLEIKNELTDESAEVGSAIGVPASSLIRPSKRRANPASSMKPELVSS